MKILVFVYVLMYVYLDCYMNNIGDMQNEKYFYDHYNEFEYNHDFLKFLWKIDDVKDLHLI